MVQDSSGACRVTAISAGGDHTLVLTVGGALLAFGCNKHGCLGLGDTCKRTIATQVCHLLFPGNTACCISDQGSYPSAPFQARPIIHACNIGQLLERPCLL